MCERQYFANALAYLEQETPYRIELVAEEDDGGDTNTRVQVHALDLARMTWDSLGVRQLRREGGRVRELMR